MKLLCRTKWSRYEATTGGKHRAMTRMVCAAQMVPIDAAIQFHPTVWRNRGPRRRVTVKLRNARQPRRKTKEVHVESRAFSRQPIPFMEVSFLAIFFMFMASRRAGFGRLGWNSGAGVGGLHLGSSHALRSRLRFRASGGEHCEVCDGSQLATESCIGSYFARQKYRHARPVSTGSVRN